MKKIIFKYLIILPVMVSLSCGDEWLDVNTDPNNPSNAPINNVFPAAVLSTASVVGGEGMILGGIWAQYWTQNNASNQYKTYDRFDVVPSDFEARYQELYAGALNDYERVKRDAAAEENWEYYLMATVMQSYTYQILVDLYNSVPFTEALKGDQGIINPVFDDGQAIYDSLIARIDFALSKPLSEVAEKGGGDYLFGGDMESWRQFANTLKLKIYLRQSDVRSSVAQAGITALLADPVGFLTVDAKVDAFVDEESKSNPLYEQDQRKLNTQTNLKASHTLMSFLQANSDTSKINRLFIKPTGKPHLGMLQGNHEAPTTVLDPLTVSRARIQATDPVYFLSASESYFLQAEAELRFGTPANAKALYDAGVTASFIRVGSDADEAEDFLDAGPYEYPDGSMDENWEAIMMQKWISLAGVNHLEAFFELNRTNIPERSPVGGDNVAYVPGQLTRPINSVLSGNARPQRLFYPDLEVQRNSNTPEQVNITDRIWWDASPEP